MNIIFYAHGEKWRKGNEDKKMTYLDRFFHLTERNTSVRTEIIAGLTTFLSCVSIVVLNPSILSAAGMDIRAFILGNSDFLCDCLRLDRFVGKFPLCLGTGHGT